MQKAATRSAFLSRARRGFTLVEILVVVAIIVLLIAIIIPVLGSLRSKGKESNTRALLGNLTSAIDNYYQLFHAYPGPAGQAQTSVVSGNKISGAQNLLLGLSYGLDPTTGINVPGMTHKVVPGKATGPVNFATSDKNGNPEQLPPYFSPTPAQVSKGTGTSTWANGGVTGSAPASSNAFAFPVLVDAYGDALPVLYYRRTPGVDGTSPTKVTDVSPSASTAAYYLNDNIEYTAATALEATSGTTTNQTAGQAGGMSTTDLGKHVLDTSSKARGGYLLLSAGTDRVYGTLNTKNDDIAVVGGN